MERFSMPILLIIIWMLIYLVEFIFEMTNPEVQKLKKAKCLRDIDSINLEVGFTTSSFKIRYLKLILLYICFLSVDISNLSFVLVITLIFLIGFILMLKSYKIFYFTNDYFEVRDAFNYSKYVFDKIEKTEYHIGGKGTAFIKIIQADGFVGKHSFKPSNAIRDDLAIQLILKEKTSLRVKRFRKWDSD